MDNQDAAWGGRPCEFQLPNGWAVQEPATAEAWSPAAGLPVSMDHIDMFGTCSLPAYVPQSCLGQQLVEYYYAAPPQPNWPVAEVPTIDVQNSQVVVDLQNEETHTKKVSADSRVCGVFNQVSHEFEADMDIIKQKMHKYPASLLGALHESYTVPRVVAIGPYHHNRDHLKQAENVKHMAAIRCVIESGHLLEEVYSAVVSSADLVRRLGLYDKDVMKGIGYDEFRHMMFFDACFLVQYMRLSTDIAVDESLHGFFGPNRRNIHHDLILLENQLPWKVVEAVLRFMPDVRLGRFISRWKVYVQHHRKPKEEEDSHVSALIKDKTFKPHLLGLLRYYTVGRSRDTNSPNKQKPKKRSISVSAIELAEIGIWLTANKTMKLIDMGLVQEGSFFAELSLAPLSLDRNRASYLLNMAALELCTIKRFGRAQAEDSAVCSYLQLLALLVTRVDDVQELRASGLLQGGGGLTDEQAFRFLTSFQGLPFGKCYNRVMEQIEIYKENKPMGTKLYAFLYNNKKTIAAVFGVFVALFGIIGTLVSVKKAI
ncbi:unnamed protein product [Miscanthus lutarioriparius]|uniref:Uncharacterized protein n=1 Tax=Miscanthus lutarioriparius TaxID=422564 RepID=A0A811Q9W5_9POAL|nr:unnamed protein product [Miscanthus lutarioriparius]